MSYTKQNFKSREKLYASQLNAMDDQIAKNESEKITKPSSATVGQVIAVKSVDETNIPIEFEAVNLPDGVKGEDGVGIKSVEQTIKSEEDDGINVITVTMTNGDTATFELQNGSKGDEGATPEKGVDYYTEGDKEEMIAEILSRVTDASEVAY